MSQTPLLVALHLVGVLICLAIGPRHRPALCCALGLPVGLAVVVPLVLAALVVGIPYNVWSFGVILAVPSVASALVLRRRGLDARTAWIAIAWTVGFATACLALTATNWTLMTHDSHIYTMYGWVIRHDGALRADVLSELDEWGVFQVVAQSMAQFTSQDLLYALPLVFGVSFIPVFALTLWHGLAVAEIAPRRRALLVLPVCLALFTIHMVVFHIGYLHTNWSSAVYLFGFVVLFWLAEVERDPAGVPVAFLCLIALALQRTETPLVALIFLALTVAQSRLPRPAITRWLAVFVVVVGGWYEVLAHSVAAEGAFLTPGRCRIVWATLLVTFLWWLASTRPLLQRINRALPAVVGIGGALSLAAAFALKTDHMATSAHHWWRSLTEVPHWSWTWYAVPVLALLALLAPAPRFRQAFAIGIPVFFGFVLLLALGRDPYRVGVDDSANRMTIHVVPLIFWYLGLKVMSLLGKDRAA